MAALYEIQDWLSRNYDKVNRHAGRWIAVSGGGVVEAANSLDALMKKLSEEQKREFLVTRVPTRKEAANLVY